MKFIFRYIRLFKKRIVSVVCVKFLGVLGELSLPFLLEHILDDVVPSGQIKNVILWGLLMIFLALMTAFLNIMANRRAVDNAKQIAYCVRQDLFVRTFGLSGRQFDAFGLPSLTSRMTSDSYNIQQFAQTVQVMFIRAPFLMFGGIIMMLLMDPVLASILILLMLPLFVLIYTISRRGIPLFNKVQEKLDALVRIMRESISGIRVVKALNKSDYEKERFAEANEEMYRANVTAGTVMALPGPLMNIGLNAGLAVVVFVGAGRVDSGAIRAGVVLASLTYFNYILNGMMGLNRILMLTSKASASAGRIAEVVDTPKDLLPIDEKDACRPSGKGFVRMEHVGFRYNESAEGAALEDISFSLNEGESLGIIGPTGSGKSTIVQLLMRFYDVQEGAVFIDGKDVRCCDTDELRRLFGVVFQNDIIFRDTLRDNIAFGRDIPDEAIDAAVRDAMAASFVYELKGGLDFCADIKGANLSGGQKQRLLISRALAGKPRILILDDSSSALDYSTDAQLRANIAARYAGAATILIAQRISSVRNLDRILVINEGHMIGYGTHEELLESCPYYRSVYRAQMGALA